MHWNKKLSFVRAIRRRPESRATREICAESGIGNGRRGFTLIELMVVVVILAVAAAIVVPMASSGATMQLRSAVNMLAADLEYAKSLSIGTGRWHSVDFDTNNDTYVIRNDVMATIQHPVTKRDYIVNFRTDRRLGQVRIADTNFDGEDRVIFDYLGTPHRPDGMNLAPVHNGVVTLSAGGVSRMVRVEPVTGFISILD